MFKKALFSLSFILSINSAVMAQSIDSKMGILNNTYKKEDVQNDDKKKPANVNLSPVLPATPSSGMNFLSSPPLVMTPSMTEASPIVDPKLTTKEDVVKLKEQIIQDAQKKDILEKRLLELTGKPSGQSNEANLNNANNNPCVDPTDLNQLLSPACLNQLSSRNITTSSISNTMMPPMQNYQQPSIPCEAMVISPDGHPGAHIPYTAPRFEECYTIGAQMSYGIPGTINIVAVTPQWGALAVTCNRPVATQGTTISCHAQ